MRQITSQVMNNINISGTSGSRVLSYTLDADRDIFIRMFANSVGGNGTYTVYCSLQRLGSGVFYEFQPRTSGSVAASITSIAYTTVPIPAKNTDVIQAFLIGTAQDTNVSTVITEVWEQDYLRPLTAGQYNTSISTSGSVQSSTLNVNNDKTGYSLSQSFPANFSSLSISASGSVPASLVSGNVEGDIHGKIMGGGSSNIISTGAYSQVSGYSSGQTPLQPTVSGRTITVDSSGSVMASSVSGTNASDPLLNAVPGIYESGTAGNALGRIGSGQITTVNPISASGTNLTIVRGDDYLADDGRALEWIDVSAAWPVLTGGTVLFTAKKNTRDSTLTVTGSVVNATGSNKKVRAEPTHSQTTGLKLGTDWLYDVQVTLPSGSVITLVRGSMAVVEDYSTPN